MSKEFIDEVNQDLHDDRIMGLWKRFGRYVIGGAFAIVAVTAGNVGYDYYIDSKNNTEALAIENILSGDSSEIDELIKNGGEGAVFVATINKARTMTDFGNNVDASEFLLKYAQTASSPQKEYAQLASVWVNLENGNVDKMIKIVDSVISNNTYVIIARFTKVELLISKGNKSKAIGVLNSIVNDSNATSGQRDTAKSIRSSLKL